jgi:hypothetical protein
MIAVLHYKSWKNSWTRSCTHITSFPKTMFGTQNLRFRHARDCSGSMTKYCCHSCFSLTNAHTSLNPWDSSVRCQLLTTSPEPYFAEHSDKNTNYQPLAKLSIQIVWRKPRMLSMLRARITQGLCKTYTTCCKMVGNCKCAQADYTKHNSTLPNSSAKKMWPAFQGCSWAEAWKT